MEIPVMCRLSDLEASLGCLNTQSTLLSRLFSSSGLEIIVPTRSFWKWGALLLALVAALSSVANAAVKILILRLQNFKSLAASSKPLLTVLDDAAAAGDEGDDGFTTDGEDDACSSPSSTPSSDDEGDGVDENFRVAGSSSSSAQGYDGHFSLRRSCHGGDGGGGFRERFSWSDFAGGRSVVKLWDGLGLGFNVETYSIWDASPAATVVGGALLDCAESRISTASPAVVVAAAATDGARNLALSVWDNRIGRRTPAIYAEWGPQKGTAAREESGGVGTVYVGDDFTGELTVGDLRSVRAPLGKVAEEEGAALGGDTWWDADAVVVPREAVDDSAASCCDSVAARFYLF